MSSYPDAFKLQCLCDKTNCVNIKCSCPCQKCNRKNIALTTHCQPFGTPMKVIQDNKIDYPYESSHIWSNNRAYGNIVIGSSDSCGTIYGRVAPFNRIPKLNEPYDTNVVPDSAWSNKDWKKL